MKNNIIKETINSRECEQEVSKKIKNCLDGGAKLLGLLLVTGMLLQGSVFSAFAISPNDSVEYSAYRVTSDLAVFNAMIDNKSYEGTCAEAGNPLSATGSATYTGKISNSSKPAMVLYYLVYEKKFFESPERDKTLDNFISTVGSGTSWTQGLLVEAVAQISAMGIDGWKSAMETLGTWNDTTSAMYDWYNNFDTSGISVPSDFELLTFDAGTSQNFYLWRYEPSGTLKLKKKSANPSITG